MSACLQGTRSSQIGDLRVAISSTRVEYNSVTTMHTHLPITAFLAFS
jgi:hypothetical protein